METDPLGVPAQRRPWREWYQLEAWRRRRRLQLTRFPLCKLCEDRGVVTLATIADHIESHRGDWNKFRLGDLQSLCAQCHGSSKRRQDIDGYDAAAIGTDGWPLDPRHPANKSARQRADTSWPARVVRR